MIYWKHNLSLIKKHLSKKGKTTRDIRIFSLERRCICGVV
nr:MAG TPA: hypothetical protein [Caudoviricetes sp.]